MLLMYTYKRTSKCIHLILWIYMCLLIVSFNQSVYFINKQDKVVTLTLVFNQTLTSSNITVHIHVYNGASTGESSGDDCESGKCVYQVVFSVI